MNGKLKLQLPSPFHEVIVELFISKKVRVFFKRDDLIHEDISGNKWRKLKYNIREANGRPILTFGGAFSNHIAASAAACSYFNCQSIGIIRGEQPNELNNTLKFAEDSGMKLEFISRTDYRNKTSEDFLERLKYKYNQPYIIPEGGSNYNGMKGCEEMIEEIPKDFDYILSAVGTGTTLAGICLGLKKHQHAIGIPVLKGAEYLGKEIEELLSLKRNAKNDKKHSLNHDYHFGGYAKINTELIRFMNDFFDRHAIKTDPVYSGKSLYALFDLIKKDTFPQDSKIIFYHCGGLQGIEGIENRYGINLF